MSEKNGNKEHGDLVIEKAMEQATNGLSRNEASKAIKDALEGMSKLAARFKGEGDKGYEQVKPSDIPKNLSYMAKMIDEISRLMQLLDGKPDSRPQFQAAAMQEILSVFTDEQIRILQRWRKENQSNDTDPIIVH